jgi:hypothetical protein
MSNWKRPENRPERGRVVWIIEYHPKQIYPQSYEIHAGEVECSYTDPSFWRVAQNDESGSGWCSWEPDDILAWCYAEDFTEVADVLASFQATA